MIEIPTALTEYAQKLEEKTTRLRPDLAPLAKQCYLNTIETTVKQCENGDYFVITGDIPALWLRDSAAQLRPYIPLCKESGELCEIIKGVIRRHVFYVNLDPYSNAFNEVSHERAHRDETDFTSPYIWERKYEVDSLCASVYLAYDYYKATGDTSIFSEDFKKMLLNILGVFKQEQDHAANSNYYFIRKNCPETDTIPLQGKGNPTGYTGMTWSGFRPSDDRCIYNYLIPANMMAVVAMKKAAEMLIDGYKDETSEKECLLLAEKIDEGIRKYGVVEDPDFGKIYAYETDGLGHHVLMDDANSPSLLAMPYIGYCDKNDELYQNTRRFILSAKNPFYFSGSAAHGIGSPHTGKDKIWHISLIMQILTSTDEKEKKECLDMISATHAEKYFMHESFNKDDPTDFTRSWFAWANALFAQMLSTL